MGSFLNYTTFCPIQVPTTTSTVLFEWHERQDEKWQNQDQMNTVYSENEQSKSLFQNFMEYFKKRYYK